MAIIPGFKVLLMGPPGTGKTTSLASLETECGLKVRAIWGDHKFGVATSKAPGIKGIYIPPAKPSWDSLLSAARIIHMSTYESIANMKAGIERNSMTQFMDVVETCKNFRFNGESLGGVDTWGTDTVFVFDPLTALNQMSKDLLVGMKANLHQGEWGAVMANEMRLIEKWTFDVFCHVVVVAHVEREMSELTNSTKIMPSVLGRKLAPVLPGKFTDVILTSREGASFYWSTADSQADVIGLNIPIKDKLTPGFKQLFEGWKARGGRVVSEVPANWGEQEQA